MKLLLSLLFVLALLLGSTALAVAQARTPVQPDGDRKSPALSARDYSALIQEVFAPVTDDLKLTKEQEFRIIAIITGTEVKSDPLLQKLDEVGRRLVEATLVDAPDEATINRLSTQEAFLLTQIIAMKSRAKASISHVLYSSDRDCLCH